MSDRLKVEHFELKQFAPVLVFLGNDTACISLDQTATAVVELRHLYTQTHTQGGEGKTMENSQKFLKSLPS